MTATIGTLDDTIQKTNAWLEELARLGSFTDQNQAYTALRAVLHGLRDRMPVGEASDLASQLPMLIRGFYYEGWKPALAPNKERSTEDFVNHVQQSLRSNTEVDPGHAVQAVLALLNGKISEGQMAHLKQVLPEDVVERYWPS